MKFLCSLFFSFAALLAGANSLPNCVTVPFFAEAGDMETSSVIPFNIGSNATARYQQIYNASDFEIRAPDGGFIERIWFRPDGVLGGFFERRLLPSIQVNLSTTSRAADGLSPLFAENIGFDEAVVYGPGPLVLSGGQGSFSLCYIPLTQPFFYNPHAGNLLLDIRNAGGGVTTFFDATAVVSDSVSRVYALDVGSSSGTVDTRGLITGFSVTPIPEPGALGLFALGLLALGLRVVSRRPQSRSATSHPNQRTELCETRKGGF